VYEARLAAYCARYAVKATREGLPPFPTGQRETPQHREWIALYKAHSRLSRRARGVCERCSDPAAPDSVFCEAHRAVPGSPPVPDTSPSPEDLRRLLKAQKGLCPICTRPLESSGADLLGPDARVGQPKPPDRQRNAHAAATHRDGAASAVHHDPATGKPRALLHTGCSRLVRMAEAAGPATLDRVRAYLRPQPGRTPR
jgi:hypothetical protein